MGDNVVCSLLCLVVALSNVFGIEILSIGSTLLLICVILGIFWRIFVSVWILAEINQMKLTGPAEDCTYIPTVVGEGLNAGYMCPAAGTKKVSDGKPKSFGVLEDGEKQNAHFHTKTHDL